MTDLDLTTTVFTLWGHTSELAPDGFLIDRDHDIAWVRWHDRPGTPDVTVWPVAGGTVHIVTADERVVGCGFPEASRRLPPALLVPGARQTVNVGVDPDRDVLAVLLLTDDTHGTERHRTFTVPGDRQPWHGSVVAETNGMLVTVLLTPASRCLPEGSIPPPTRRSRWRRRRTR